MYAGDPCARLYQKPYLYHKRWRELIYLYQQLNRMCDKYVTTDMLWSRLGQSLIEEELKADEK